MKGAVIKIIRGVSFYNDDILRRREISRGN